MLTAISMIRKLTIWVGLWATKGIASAVALAAFHTPYNNPIGIDWDDPNSSGLNKLLLVDSSARSSS